MRRRGQSRDDEPVSTVEWIAVGVVGYLIPSIPLAFVVGRALRRLDERTANGVLCRRCAARLQNGPDQSAGWDADSDLRISKGGVLTASQAQQPPWRKLTPHYDV